MLKGVGARTLSTALLAMALVVVVMWVLDAVQQGSLSSGALAAEEKETKQEQERAQAAARLLVQIHGTVQTTGSWQQSVLLTQPGHAGSSTAKPKFGRRKEFGAYLVQQQYKRGAEIGVQRGLFSREILAEWAGHGLDTLALVDVWAPQDNYIDLANVDLRAQESILQEARENLAPYKDHTLFLRMYSVEAVRWFEPHSLDFVYVDARHDYCGVMEDLQAYWPLLRPGGMLAGHDYVTNLELLAQNPGTKQDWSVCGNGTINQGAVKGAVQDFMASVGVPREAIGVTSLEWLSFYVLKPVDPEQSR